MLASLSRQAGRSICSGARRFTSSSKANGGGHGHSTGKYVSDWSRLNYYSYLRIDCACSSITGVTLDQTDNFTKLFCCLQEDYLHAEHMYNIPAMKNRKLKFGSAIVAVVGLGSAIPWIACEFQFMKARG